MKPLDDTNRILDGKIADLINQIIVRFYYVRCALSLFIFDRQNDWELIRLLQISFPIFLINEFVRAINKDDTDKILSYVTTLTLKIGSLIRKLLFRSKIIKDFFDDLDFTGFVGIPAIFVLFAYFFSGLFLFATFLSDVLQIGQLIGINDGLVSLIVPIIIFSTMYVLTVRSIQSIAGFNQGIVAMQNLGMNKDYKDLEGRYDKCDQLKFK
tara:strand:- start:91 stop:723 length:633 start_codon:yes stop_codon:yes gene_type:complete